MKVPLSWLKDFVEIDLPIEELAKRLTLAGLEVEEIKYIGLPMPKDSSQMKSSGLPWDREKFVIAEILEVMPHPNADRLVLVRLSDGKTEEIALTGAPNLFQFKGKGPLDKPLKVAYARQGARLYDGHKPGWILTTLKRTKIRGIESRSMVCSEKELGISEECEGIIVFDDDTPVGLPLVDFIGDAVFDIAITPNIARNANILGVAREVAALTGKKLKPPSYKVPWEGAPIKGRASVEIREPNLNPRFILGLIEDIEVKPSPYWVQLRLRLAGMRPINNIVDATNYAMLEIGEPLHAFDYDILCQRAGGKPPTIITRLPEPDERLTTLDEVERSLDEFSVLVADTAGALSIAGVMGGTETEVNQQTRNVLLEGAAWNFINIRQTIAAQKLSSEAAYRFSRGIHPAMAERGIRQCLSLMQQLAGGTIAKGLIDNYPSPPELITITITPTDVRRCLGINLSPSEMADILRRLEFSVDVDKENVRATVPDHRLDISQGVIGKADLMEEIARIYGYDRIPETQISDIIPPQYGNPSLEREEQLRDLLVSLGLQEVITYRLTSPEREARLFVDETPPDEQAYVRLANPISNSRIVMRHSLLASVLESVEQNNRVRDQIALFEIGPIYMADAEKALPEELLRLVITLTGRRAPACWQDGDSNQMDFYDLKGLIASMFAAMHFESVRYQSAKHPVFHPGKCADVLLDDQLVGSMGELHPLVAERYGLSAPLLAADFNLDLIFNKMPTTYITEPVPIFPPALEDLAIVVDESIPAKEIEQVILRAGRPIVTELRLFDVYRGAQIGAGRKSLAYSLVYQASDRTLTDNEVAKIRKRILKALTQELEAELRS